MHICGGCTAAPINALNLQENELRIFLFSHTTRLELIDSRGVFHRQRFSQRFRVAGIGMIIFFFSFQNFVEPRSFGK